MTRLGRQNESVGPDTVINLQDTNFLDAVTKFLLPNLGSRASRIFVLGATLAPQNGGRARRFQETTRQNVKMRLSGIDTRTR